MKILILNLIAILLFSGCSTKYVAKCPKIEYYDKNITIHINSRGGLDKDEAIKLIQHCKKVKKYYKAVLTEYNKNFTKDIK